MITTRFERLAESILHPNVRRRVERSLVTLALMMFGVAMSARRVMVSVWTQDGK